MKAVQRLNASLQIPSLGAVARCDSGRGAPGWSSGSTTHTRLSITAPTPPEVPLLHPAYPTTYEAAKGYEMTAGLGLMFDTTIALSRIILAGILDQCPKLKLVCPHVGGALPYLIGRLDHQTQVLKRGAEKIRKPPSEYLKQVYLDTVTPIALGVRYAYDFAGADRLLFASDHPWVDPRLIAGNVKSLRFPAEDEKKIFSGNARNLFKLTGTKWSEGL